MKSKKMILQTAMIVSMMVSGMTLLAQPAGGGGQGLGGPPPATSAPIDGGAGFLLAGIAAYAHRRLKAVQKDKEI